MYEQQPFTCENEHQDKHDGCVTKVQNCRRHSIHGQLCKVEMYGIYEEIDGSGAGCEIRSPPPSIILYNIRHKKLENHH